MKRISTKTAARLAVIGSAAALLIPKLFSGGAMAAPQRTASSVPQLVPLREAAEAVGAQVKWDSSKHQAEVRRNGARFTVTLGSPRAMLNQRVIELSETPAAKDGHMMIPLDALNRALGAKLSWEPQDGLIVAADDVESRALYFIYLLQHGRYADARALMNGHLSGEMPEAMLTGYWKSNTMAYGTPEKLLNVQTEQTTVHHNVQLTYASGKLPQPLRITIRFDSGGGIDDLYVAAAPEGGYQKPEYDQPAAYAEKQVVVGKGATAVPGTLTVPRGDGPFPAVVLVHGSGPEDRDESIGGNKPFRDLAVGLAAQHIAVLRYDKQTFTHTIQSAVNPRFTVEDESVDDSLAAVRVLQQEAAIDPKQIYVIGHSEGGMLVPRIIREDEEGSIAGAVIMAGPSGTLEDLMLKQYQAAVDRAEAAGQSTEALEQQLQAFQQQVDLLKDPQYSKDNIPSGFRMSNAYWWFDIRDYKGAQAAKDQHVPLLILQGDNDAQVGVDQFDGWKTALAGRQDVDYKLYPTLNHLFAAVDHPSTGAEYLQSGNVSPQVITDIAQWINQR